MMLLYTQRVCGIGHSVDELEELDLVVEHEIYLSSKLCRRSLLPCVHVVLEHRELG